MKAPLPSDSGSRGHSSTTAVASAVRVLDIDFFTGSAAAAVEAGLRGGLVVVPSAPVLVTAAEDPHTQEALAHGDLAIADSGLMAGYWNLTHRPRIPRISGLEYLQLLLQRPEVQRPGGSFWVMPSAQTMTASLAWLNRRGHALTVADCYLAPQYPAGPIEDRALLTRLEELQPPQIVMAIGGGVQERLGWFLRQRLSYRPGIHCTGAAIAFLTGEQANIPMWADRMMLGWLFRCCQSPRRFIPRYWRARKLISLLWQQRSPAPGA